MEVIDFVLEDAGVPAGSLDELRLGALVEIFDTDGARARDDGGETGEAEAAFVEIFLFVAGVGDYRIDDYVKGDGAAFSFGEVFRGEGFQQIFAVFDYGELQRQTYLRRGEAYAGSVTHGVAHFLNEALGIFAEDFFRSEQAGLFAENWLARLHNLQTHCVSLRWRSVTNVTAGEETAA